MLEEEVADAERKAWDSLARYKFVRFLSVVVDAPSPNGVGCPQHMLGGAIWNGSSSFRGLAGSFNGSWSGTWT
jgi:hypothetical protein